MHGRRLHVGRVRDVEDDHRGARVRAVVRGTRLVFDRLPSVLFERCVRHRYEEVAAAIHLEGLPGETRLAEEREPTWRRHIDDGDRPRLRHRVETTIGELHDVGLRDRALSASLIRLLLLRVGRRWSLEVTGLGLARATRGSRERDEKERKETS